MSRKLTTEEFIDKSNKIHNNFYDYSKVNYINVNTDVIIICPIHGEFKQLPHNHLRNAKCIQCNWSNRFSTIKFIDKSKLIHGDKYDYSLVNYNNISNKVIIICPIHGEFKQTPKHHLYRKQGCKKCGNKINENLLPSIIGIDKSSRFIQKAKIKHGEKYDYSNVIYKSCKIKIQIICHKHGLFLQTPDGHIRGRGCIKCSYENGRSISHTLNYFINKSNITHNNKYDYSLTEYKNGTSKVTILCPIHGKFQQIAQHHLRGHGCKKCFNSEGEIKISKFLKEKEIHFKEYVKFNDCINPKTNRKLEFDFYLPEYNICIEYDGIQHYESFEFFNGEKGLSRNQYNDKIKTEYCQNNGIELIRIPYWDIKNINQILDKKLLLNLT